MMQIFVASRLFGAMCLSAAIDSGIFGDHRRVLLTVDNSQNPETTPSLNESPGFDRIRTRFDRVISYNELIWPNHPSAWSPRDCDQALLAKLFRAHLGADEPLELVIEVMHAEPGRSLSHLFDDARITLYSDGLASYSPTRKTPQRDVLTRFERVIHLGLVPGKEPTVLSEHDVPTQTIDNESFRAVCAEVATSARSQVDVAPKDVPSALILGQYLSALGLITEDEETDIAVRSLEACAKAGHHTIGFKPHPMNQSLMVPVLLEVSERIGVNLRVIEGGLPIESWYAEHKPELVVGCFSTALATASRIYGIPIATVGTELVLEKLTPYENSNRMPLVISDAFMPKLLATGEIGSPPLGSDTETNELPTLIDAVTYCMQASAYPHLRERAATYLAGYEGDLLRYFKRKRLLALGLRAPGVAEPHPLRRVEPALVRRARNLLRKNPVVRKALGGTLRRIRELRRERN